MVKPPFPMDERNRMILYRIGTFLYLLTLIAMQISILYRQFALGQDSSQFPDLANIYTFNVLILVGAVLYFGVISYTRINIRIIGMLFTLVIVAGTVFTILKYKLTSYAAILDKMIIILAVTAIMFAFWIILAYLGKQKIDKKLSE